MYQATAIAKCLFNVYLASLPLLTGKLYSRYVKGSELGVGNFGKDKSWKNLEDRSRIRVGHFASDFATLTLSHFAKS